MEEGVATTFQLMWSSVFYDGAYGFLIFCAKIIRVLYLHYKTKITCDSKY
jgi:hypothetical protein